MLGPGAYALLGLTAFVAALAAALTFAVLRFAAAARDTRRLNRGGGETALLSAALEEAVTKLKAQERATAARADASERLSEEIIASLTAGLLVVGLDGEIRILNRAGRRMLRVPDSIDDSQLGDYRGLIGNTPLSALIDECLTHSVAVARRPVRIDGGERPTHLGVTVSPLFGDGAQLHGAISLFTDLTAIKELEEQLRLKESLATVGELTAGIAHEFRNGLATIHGYSKLLDLKSLPEGYRPYVEAIRAEAVALGEVVTNFLNFATPAKLTLSRVDLRAVCERAAEELRAEARTLGGDVTVRGDFGAVDGDEILLRQAFSNLLRNAVEACADASLAPVVVVRSDLNQWQGSTQVIVEDNGPGIPSDERDRVFRPFVTSKRTGTGLGLALVQKIIVFHNGRITVGESPLGGASFQIVLPTSSALRDDRKI
ncbi:MAG TPA: ATP-binding protein [Vicinamibacterales bacterium]|jgi:signal transduction histidine kinase|nr:ATP-binding protein [Vicinamibacterales bacterium]